MALRETRRQDLDLQSAEPAPVTQRNSFNGMYKAMVITSFVINMLLVIVVAILAGIALTQRNQIMSLTTTARGFASENISELRDVVADLQNATIVYNVPLQTNIPVILDVPLQSGTVVTLTQQVPLQLPATVVLAGGAGQLQATVNLALPEGLQLPIALNLNVPINEPLPVDLNVPVRIPLAETELGPQFERLGGVVDRLVKPVAPMLELQPASEPPEPQRN